MIAYKNELIARFAGEYCCRIDHNLTIEDDIAGLVGLFGYSVEELDSIYHNSILELTEADYREKLKQVLESQLDNGEDIELIFPVCHKNGNIVWVLNRGHRVITDAGEEYLVGVLVDITRSKLGYDAERQMTYVLQERAERDSLTKIYNAQTARKRSEQYLTDLDDNGKCALLIIDLDDFKQINDKYGHMFGDAVLVQVAQTIQRLFRSKDIIGRIGGEEFLILMKDIPGIDIVNTRCSQLNAAFHDIFKNQLSGHTLSCSIGAALAPDHGKSYFELFSCADQALYLAKDQGKDGFAFYDAAKVKELKGKSATHFGDYDEGVLSGYINNVKNNS